MRRIVFVAVLLLSLVISSVAAATPNSEKGIDQALLKKGYPAEFLQQIPLGLKKDLLKETATYVGHQTEVGTLTEDGFIEAASGEMQAQALSNFYHGVILSQQPSVDNEYRYVVRYWFDWRYSPFVTATDKIAVAWADAWNINKLVPAEWSYTVSGYRWDNPNYRSSKTFSGTGYDHFELEAGVGWDIDILDSFVSNTDGELYHDDRHEGWGRVEIRMPYNTKTEKQITDFLGKYYHAEASCSGAALSFASQPSITIDCWGGYDESGPATNDITWYK